MDDEKPKRRSSRPRLDSDELLLTYPIPEYNSFGHAGGKRA